MYIRHVVISYRYQFLVDNSTRADEARKACSPLAKKKEEKRTNRSGDGLLCDWPRVVWVTAVGGRKKKRVKNTRYCNLQSYLPQWGGAAMWLTPDLSCGYIGWREDRRVKNTRCCNLQSRLPCAWRLWRGRCASLAAALPWAWAAPCRCPRPRCRERLVQSGKRPARSKTRER